MHACPPASKQAQMFANCNNSSISSKIKRYYSTVRDISTFKRTLHCVMRDKRSALVFRRRNKPRHTQIALICRFRRKLRVISLPLQIFRCFNALFTALCVRNVVRVLYVVETSPETRESQSFVDFDENYAIFFSRSRYFDV